MKHDDEMFCSAASHSFLTQTCTVTQASVIFLAIHQSCGSYDPGSHMLLLLFNLGQPWDRLPDSLILLSRKGGLTFSRLVFSSFVNFFLKEITYVHQDSIYLMKNIVKQ